MMDRKLCENVDLVLIFVPKPSINILFILFPILGFVRVPAFSQIGFLGWIMLPREDLAHEGDTVAEV